jgi:hypothetical protein
MKKMLLTAFSLTLMYFGSMAQTNYWSQNAERGKIVTDKAVARLSFPKEFKLFNLDLSLLRQDLLSVAGSTASRHSTTITLPNADGAMEEFEVFEASNFDAELQARFPEIRAFSGKGITDKYATLKLSISPQGVQAMVFRTEKENEFIEPYSQNHATYAVFKSQSKAGALPWSCSTADRGLAADLSERVAASGVTARSGGNLKTMRLAQSVTAEYSNYFGATSASQVSLVLAAINATLTRCNGVYEKDLALHLNLISQSTNVIFYNASTDPYSNASVGTDPNNANNANGWNIQLQNTLNTTLGGSLSASNALYDIGHLFGASGGGGNAGCIGCICVNPTGNGQAQKGSGYTSPGDAIPQGDNFDIDYVVHEVGHQLGANHTFSNSTEGTGVNKEVGSGITIMGYAGITANDVAPHSIAYYHEASIAQIQSNLSSKTCPVTTTIANATPVVAALTNRTIPVSTPFALTGSATDADGNALTYSWEQDNTGTTATEGASSKASPTKTVGPNWISFSPTTSPTRYFPQLSTILAGGLTTGPLSGGDAGMTMEALSSVSRTLNFRLTVRDNAPYSTTAPVSVGQTQFADMVVTVSNTSGPFSVTSPNTAVSWAGNSTQAITWAVANTTASPVSCANVKISLSTDGGLTFPTVLSASTPNDGTESLVIPNTPSTTARIKVESVGNIFFDISNTNFTITAGSGCGSPSGLSSSAVTTSSATVSWSAVSGATSYDADYKLNSSSTWTNAATATTSLSAGLSSLTAASLYDWRVRANCSSGSSAYTQAQLTTLTAGGGCGTAFEPNETQGAAATISANVSNSAAITTATDVDYFAVATTGTSNNVFNLAGPSGVDYDLVIYNSAGTQIGTSTSATATESVSLTNQAAGTYYIKVLGYNGANSATCYTITANVTPVSTGCISTYDNSTNGTTGGAATIPFNTNITGLISPANDVDNYKFVITTGGTITVTLGTLPGDYDLKLLNSAGTQVAISENGSTTSESISYTAAAGTYYAQVIGYNGANSSTVCYTLKVQLGTASKMSDEAPVNNATALLKMAPNPTRDILNISLLGTQLSKQSVVQILDIKGTVMIQQSLRNTTQALNVSKLTAGTYIVKISNGSSIITSKFVKE